jgi:uncharacterized protein
MNSCLYETHIFHHRVIPRDHRFSYKFFSFYADLDEIDMITRESRWVSRNRWNLYGFYDRDHVVDERLDLKSSVTAWLAERGVDISGGRVMLLTYFRTFGHIFNPVSFFFCYNAAGFPVGVVAEVGNTFGEQKLFLINADLAPGDEFRRRVDKLYYVSPFTRLDDQFEFRLKIPDEGLDISVETSRRGQKVIGAKMTGNRIQWTDGNLLALTARFPWVTVKVITLIHWQALQLWLKKIPYVPKSTNPHQQKEVYRARR